MKHGKYDSIEDEKKCRNAHSLWTELFDPLSSGTAQLAVNRRKVDSLYTWLTSGYFERPMLVLTGPCGSAKASTLLALAYSLSLDVVEYSSVTPLANFILQAVRFASSSKKTLLLVRDWPLLANASLFAVHRALRSLLYGKRYSFRIAFLFSEYSLHPDLLIQDSSFEIPLKPGTVIPADCVNFVELIIFNQVPPTLLRKALNQISLVASNNSSASIKTKCSYIDTIVASSNGDLRNSIIMLQFACSLFSPLIQPKSISQVFLTKIGSPVFPAPPLKYLKKKKIRKMLVADSDSASEGELTKSRFNDFLDYKFESKSKRKVSKEFDDCFLFEKNMTRDGTIPLFSALGKILYNKRENIQNSPNDDFSSIIELNSGIKLKTHSETPLSSNLKKMKTLDLNLPVNLISDWARLNPLNTKLVTLVNQIPVSTEAYTLMLHANVPDFINTLQGIEFALSNFSFADSMLRMSIPPFFTHPAHILIILGSVALSHEIKDLPEIDYSGLFDQLIEENHQNDDYIFDKKKIQLPKFRQMKSSSYYSTIKKQRERISGLTLARLSPLEAEMELKSSLYSCHEKSFPKKNYNFIPIKRLSVWFNKNRQNTIQEKFHESFEITDDAKSISSIESVQDSEML